MASTNYSASGSTGVIGSYVECIDHGSGSITLKLYVKRKDDAASIDGTYRVSGADSASGSYILTSSYTEIWSKKFNVSASGGTASLNLSFTITATSPSAGVKTVNASLSEVYLDSGGDSGGGSGSDPSEVEYYLWVYASDNVEVTVHRTYVNSAYIAEGDYVGELVDWFEDRDEYGLWYGHRIWHDDAFTIEIKAADGYTIDENETEIEVLQWDATYNVWYFGFDATEDPYVWATAKVAGHIYIDNGTTLEAYQVFIDNGSNMDRYVPYIDNGSGWDACD
jgi:hypothetical protein